MKTKILIQLPTQPQIDAGVEKPLTYLEVVISSVPRQGEMLFINREIEPDVKIDTILIVDRVVYEFLEDCCLIQVHTSQL
jgi:hypothetical protein